MNAPIIVSSPGRADLLNTHQDYKGLPVVPVGINLRMRLSATVTGKDVFTIKSLDLEKCNEPSVDTFKIEKNEMLESKFFGNYFRGVMNILVRRRLTDKLKGMEVMVKSEIPIGSGLASSAALEVAFVALLNYAFKMGFTKRDLAEITFAAESQEVGVPCGRLDQYGVAFGGIIKLECRPPYEVENLPFKNLTFAIIDSGIRHSTGEIHPKREEEINRGLEELMMNPKVPRILKRKLGYRYDQPRWEEISEDHLEDFVSFLDEEARKRILFTIRMQRLTEFALKVLRFEGIGSEDMIRNLGDETWKFIERSPSTERNHIVLGEVMNRQHALLRDLYEVSLPRLEDICSAALESGAYGAKISGAGMGGSIIALVKNAEDGQRVIDSCSSVGAKNGWVSNIGDGVRIESQ